MKKAFTISKTVCFKFILWQNQKMKDGDELYEKGSDEGGGEGDDEGGDEGGYDGGGECGGGL